MISEKTETKFIIAEVKPEPTEFTNLIRTPQSQYSQVQVIDKYARSAVTVKKEEDVPIKLDTIGVTQNISSTRIAPIDIKIKLHLDDNDPCINKKDTSDDCGKITKISKKFASPIDLMNRMIHQVERNCMCEICRKSSRTELNAPNRTKINAAERNHKCEICAKCFKIKENLSKHMKIHTGEKNFKCEICSKCFTLKENVSRHMKIHTAERNYKCDVCTKCFKMKENLAKHMKIHTEEKSHKCEICSKCFTTEQHLSNHVKLHTGERNYKCEICAKRFTTKQNVSKHMRIHTNGRNYMCEVCAKSFATKTDLVKHMEMHTSERNYRCEICDKCFITKRNLTRHMRIHTSERNYKCEICGKCFKTKENLSTHLKIHAGKTTVFLEENATQPLRKLYDVQNIGKIGKSLIKEGDTASVKKEKLEINNDTIQREPPTSESDGQIEEKIRKSTEIFDLWQTLNSEIIIKEDKNLMTTT